MSVHTPDPPHAQASLRILATTDLHGCLSVDHLPGGIEKAAGKISELRDTALNCLVFDNGDFLQGAPICDLAASAALDTSNGNPIIDMMNSIGYDAVGLGNHEFDYGLAYLHQACEKAEFPILCSNIKAPNALWSRDLLLTKELQDHAGRRHSVKIGVFSLVPPQVRAWCRVHLEGQAEVSDFLQTSQDRVASLRARGADLVIALCHAGNIGSTSCSNDGPFAQDIAGVAGLNIIICGHTHQVFPPAGEDQRQHRCTSNAAPSILAGDRGKFVGCIDLTLTCDAGGWTWVEADVRTIPVDAATPSNPATAAVSTPWRTRADRALARIVGQTDIDISSHFSLVECDPGTRLAAAAKLHVVAPLLAASGYQDASVVVTASPFNVGIRGPEAFLSVRKGALTLESVYDIYPYLNAVDAFEISGRQLRDWLEASVSAYLQIQAGQADQRLWDDRFAAYEFDSLFGVTYDIDLTQPALFGPTRQPNGTKGSGRIRNLCLNGHPLDPDASFVFVTNAYRGGGGGNFPHVSDLKRIPLPFIDVRDGVEALLHEGLTEAKLPEVPWAFKPITGASAIFDTGRYAHDFVPNTLRHRLSDLGQTADGFRTYRLAFHDD